uniref:Ubiquitin-like domain-containing protein n=1 Tax=Parascaris univalens TaxID=6257 RepID=A0A915AEL7_PARUN
LFSASRNCSAGHLQTRSKGLIRGLLLLNVELHGPNVAKDVTVKDREF